MGISEKKILEKKFLGSEGLRKKVRKSIKD
jgi:hypothetical protein